MIHEYPGQARNSSAIVLGNEQQRLEGGPSHFRVEPSVKTPFERPRNQPAGSMSRHNSGTGSMCAVRMPSRPCFGGNALIGSLSICACQAQLLSRMNLFTPCAATSSQHRNSAMYLSDTYLNPILFYLSPSIVSRFSCVFHRSCPSFSAVHIAVVILFLLARARVSICLSFARVACGSDGNCNVLHSTGSR
jgi:hypothetical protein